MTAQNIGVGMRIMAKPRATLPPIADRRAIGKGAGITATELAAHIGVSTATVHLWESGEREPSGSRREAYAKALSELASQVGYEPTDA
jgi:DNA-binding transcriptional regulator YiaG